MDSVGTSSKGPLEGITVIELATVIMGPYAGQLLADLGATVLKVESDRLDSSRVMGGGPHPQLSGIALNLHRNKRSVQLDLKSPGGREAFLRLLDTADVLLTNLRPGPLQRLELDYDQVSGRCPGLVYCQAQGFATSDPAAARPAYDDIIQATTGLPWLQHKVLGSTSFLPTLIADKVSGMFVAYGILGALVKKGRTGRGQRVEVPMFNALLAFNLVEHLGLAATPGKPTGYSRIMTSNRGPHRTRDGHIALMPYTDEHWRALFAAVGREDILERPWFSDHRQRLLQADRVYGDLAEVVAQRTTAEWLELCESRSIPASAVPDLDRIVEDPVLHHGVIGQAEHPVVGTYRSVEVPVIYSASTRPQPSPAPLVGQDTAEVLAAVGYSQEEIASLVQEGAVGLGE